MAYRYHSFRILRDRNRGIFLSTWSVVAVILPGVAHACAVCLTGSAGDPVADAFNWSVLFLMATPYAVVGSIAGWLFFTYRRAGRKRKTIEREGPVIQLACNHKESGR